MKDGDDKPTTWREAYEQMDRLAKESLRLIKENTELRARLALYEGPSPGRRKNPEAQSSGIISKEFLAFQREQRAKAEQRPNV